MSKLNLLLLFCLLFIGCDSKNKEEQPILVTNIVMPAQGTVFQPGDKVTISAQGFQTDDEIMFSMRWPLVNQVIQEGYAIGVRGVIIEKTATNITFLAPGHYPASTTEVLLCRSGERMSLGKISVADGQAPKELQLYGIINSRSNAMRDYAIEHIDMENGHITVVEKIVGNQDFTCVVSDPGSSSLYGVWTNDDHGNFGIYDLSMKYWKSLDNYQILTTGISSGGVLTVYQHGDCLYVNKTESTFLTRMNMPPLRPDYGYKLPEGFKAESLSRYPFIQLEAGYFLFSADNGDGTFSPVVLDGRNPDHKRMYVYNPIQAVSMIPFWTVKPVVGQGATKYTRVGGFVISKNTDATNEDNNKTELRLWNTETQTLDEPFTKFPNTARSAATLISDDSKKQELYVLFNTYRGDGLIQVYDFLKKEWRQFRNFNFPYSEIVLAR